jgi:hypothetical protein
MQTTATAVCLRILARMRTTQTSKVEEFFYRKSNHKKPYHRQKPNESPIKIAKYADEIPAIGLFCLVGYYSIAFIDHPLDCVKLEQVVDSGPLLWIRINHFCDDANEIRAQLVFQVVGKSAGTQLVPCITATWHIQVGGQLEYGHAQAEYISSGRELAFQHFGCQILRIAFLGLVDILLSNRNTESISNKKQKNESLIMETQPD